MADGAGLLSEMGSPLVSVPDTFMVDKVRPLVSGRDSVDGGTCGHASSSET